MNNNHDNFRKSDPSKQKLTVNTTANMKKAGVKKIYALTLARTEI